MDYKVSVVIPTYKRNSIYLKRAIDSVLMQSYKNIEAIVVDDNPPGSEHRKIANDAMKEYENNDRVVYHQNKENVGGSYARNNGINIAKGDYITFLDDDDRYLEDKVKDQLEFMVKSGYDMTFTDLKLVNENEIVVDYREYSGLKAFDNDTLLKYHIKRHLTGTPTFMYKAEKLKEIGGFEFAKVGQEFYLMLKTIERDLNIGYFPSCGVVAYRHHEGGISFGMNKIVGEKTLYDFKKKYFDIFTSKEKRFIKFRHRAVLVVSFIRIKKYLKAFINLLLAFFASPVDFVREGGAFVKKVRKLRRKSK